MSMRIPHAIAKYVEATNIGDTDLLLSTLTTDAVVSDEGRDYRGPDQIRAWKSRHDDAGQFTLELVTVAEVGNQAVATAHVSGDFPGSPAERHFHFRLRGTKIAALSIRP